MNVPEWLEGRRVCVCAGAGGVGKTTTSAAIALGMAGRGAKVAVVTIDPARRLANALGLRELSNEPRRVETGRLHRAGLAGEGELWAMMLDPKRTFDELIDRVAPSPARAEQIKLNPVYRELSSAVSGSQEFTAVAKIHELDQAGEFDLVVLDTPPSRNALDFLDAPSRITGFLEGRGLRAFTRPTGLGMKMIGFGASPLLGALKRITGVDLVGDLMTFFALLGDMTRDFQQRAADVEALLTSPRTAFLIISSAARESVDEAIWLRRTLAEGGFPFAGAIVNRYHHSLLDGEALPPLSALPLQPDLAGRVAANLRDHERLAVRDAGNVARLEAELAGEPALLVPHLDDDVHDIEGLMRVQRYLFGTAAERRALLSEALGQRAS